MKRKALGKGLRSLIPEAPSRKPGREPAAAQAPAAAERETPRPARPGGPLQIDLDLIRPNPSQPRRRFDDESLDNLARSLAERGVLQPVVVRPAGDRYELVAGERRWRAAQRAGLLKVPAIVQHVSDDELLEVALIENVQREDLNPIEEAAAYRTLIDELDLTQEQVADRVGKQRSTVANMLRMLTLPPRVQDLIEAGSLSAGHAKALAALGSPRQQQELAQRIVRKGLSVRQVEAVVAGGGRRRRPATGGSAAGDPRDPNVAAAEEALQRELGTRVQIVTGRKGGGHLQIRYHDEDELQRLYDILMRRGTPADRNVGA